MKKIITTFALFAAVAATSASAAPVTGILGFGGPGVLSFSTGGGAPGTNFIDWCPVNTGPEPGVGCGVSSAGIGDLSVDSRTGDFVAADPVNSSGTIRDITDNPAAPAPYTFIPLGVPVSISGFFDFADPWTYTLTSITPQTCAPSATQVCTGYFNLVQVGRNVSVNLAGIGTITNGAGEVSNFDLLITGNFSGTTIPAVIAAATSGGGIFSNSWSGELRAEAGPAIPEPGTIGMALIGLGLVGANAMRRRKA
jgi:hypothetical protein